MHKWPLHPFLFALFSILSFYAVSTAFCIPGVLIFPVTIAMVAVAIVLVSFLLLSRSLAVAACMTTIAVFLFSAFRFAYENVCNLQMLLLYAVRGSQNVPISGLGFMFAWVILGLVALVACLRNKIYIEGKNGLFNTIACCCLLVSLGDVLVKEVSRRQTAPIVMKAVQGPVLMSPLKSETKPDIYYIILDGCARPDVLKELYRYDNQRFCNYLRAKGFYIAEKSHSNYQMTPLSLGSTLNLNYVNAASKYLPKSSDWFAMIELIENNLVVKSLKSIGYKYVMFKSDWAVTQGSPLADQVIVSSWNDVFLNRLLSTTLWPFVEDHLRILRSEACVHWLRTFEKGGNLGKSGSPKFVFLHSVLPHPPYLFHADGSRVESGPLVMHLEEYSDKHSFVEQVQFTERKTEELIDKLLASSGPKPIIIIQSDHGPASLDFNIDASNPSREFLNERFSIINAYYFPNADYSQLYDSISPVNTFRVVFNKYFDAKMPLLPDKSYFSNYVDLYSFTDITDQLKH